MRLTDVCGDPDLGVHAAASSVHHSCGLRVASPPAILQQRCQMLHERWYILGKSSGVPAASCF